MSGALTKAKAGKVSQKYVNMPNRAIDTAKHVCMKYQTCVGQQDRQANFSIHVKCQDFANNVKSPFGKAVWGI